MAQPTSTRSTSKRKRVEEPTQATIAPTTRSDRVWFDDGNVVLQAEQTLFKVHKSILALHSTVFKDMLSIPQPPSEGETMVEGCPVVCVSDTAVDVTIVLEALFQRSHTTSTDLEPLSIEIVTAFLRLGTKYAIDNLRVDATKRLFKEYPLSLSDFDILVVLDSSSLISGSNTASVEIDVAKLARDLGLLSVLPMALYGCCHAIHDAKDLITGVQRADGTVAKLPLDDTMSCLVACQSLPRLQSQLTRTWVTAPAETYKTCTRRDRCNAVRMQIMREALLPTEAHLWGLNDFQDHSDMSPTVRLCAACRAIAKPIHNEGRVKFWNALPGVFGLPDWEQLKNERD